MVIAETGFLVRAENYEECVRFYSEVLGLRVRYRKEGLTNFQFGGAYLLLERAEEPAPREIRERENPPFILRINVEDVARAAGEMRAKGIEVRTSSFDWGEVGNFRDPRGNLAEFCKWK